MWGECSSLAPISTIFSSARAAISLLYFFVQEKSSWRTFYANSKIFDKAEPRVPAYLRTTFLLRDSQQDLFS
jgi:hypothetical protein